MGFFKEFLSVLCVSEVKTVFMVKHGNSGFIGERLRYGQ